MPTHGNDSDFKIYSGAKNTLEFIIRDNDRKPINISGLNLTALIINDFTNETKLQKSLSIVNAKFGRAKLTIAASDIVNWSPGFYNYSVSILNDDSSFELLYHDRDQRALGFLELLGGVTPTVRDPIVILGKQFTPLTISTLPIIMVESTGAYAADNQLGLTDGFHTVAVTFTNYIGQFSVQGTINELPDSANINEWFDINIGGSTSFATLNNFTGIKSYSFTTNALWLRFIHAPDKLLNTGTLDKVVLHR